MKSDRTELWFNIPSRRGFPWRDLPRTEGEGSPLVWVVSHVKAAGSVGRVRRVKAE